MNLFSKIALYAHVLRWRLMWNRFNTHFPPPDFDNPKFMTAWDAAGLIADGAIVGTSGIGSNQRPSVLYRAIRERFLKTGHPRDLTVVGIGGQGGRGIVPGTVEELGIPGLNTCLITSHTEMFKAQLRLAQENQLELQCSILGAITHILRAQGDEGINYIIRDHTGAGTFVDPRTGGGTAICPPDGRQFVEVTEDGKLKYSLPFIDTAVFNADAADRHGNIYFKNSSVICEGFSLPKAVKRHGGKVIVNVGTLVDEGYDTNFVPAEMIDAVVYWPGTEQTGTVKQKKYWDYFTVNSRTSTEDALARVRQINAILKITAKRYPVDDVLARLATRIFAAHAHAGDHVDIGFGLPEEVARLLYESGIMKKLQMINESGAFGGISAPGIFFGASINPDEITTTAETFDRLYKRLDWAILGALQVDSRGNVNVSQRGKGAMNHVGPGGFIDLVTCAKNILFCCAFGEHSDVTVQGAKLRVGNPGKVKFIDKVDEITFNGEEALRQGKKVYYVTHLAAFHLTARGMELTHIMPGIDIQKDIIERSSMRILLPENKEPEIVSEEVVTGKDFSFSLS